jgi:hypothetical protein
MDRINAVVYVSIDNGVYEVALTNFSQSDIPRRMGRPPIKTGLKMAKQTIWLDPPLQARIVALVGARGMSDFMRTAAEHELKRRERQKPGKGATEGSE